MAIVIKRLNRTTPVANHAFFISIGLENANAATTMTRALDVSSWSIIINSVLVLSDHRWLIRLYLWVRLNPIWCDIRLNKIHLFSCLCVGALGFRRLFGRRVAATSCQLGKKNRPKKRISNIDLKLNHGISSKQYFHSKV